jgi:hypothetical protein
MCRPVNSFPREAEEKKKVFEDLPLFEIEQRWGTTEAGKSLDYIINKN